MSNLWPEEVQKLNGSGTRYAVMAARSRGGAQLVNVRRKFLCGAAVDDLSQEQT